MNALTVNVPHTAEEVAALQAEAEGVRDMVTAEPLALATPEAYDAACDVLTEIVRRKDAAVAMRRQATVPLYGVIKTIEGWFKPTVDALAVAERAVKGAVGEYRLAQAEAERQARAEAMAAAQTGDAQTMIDALTTAEQVSHVSDGTAHAVRYRWRVKRVNEDMLPDEYWTPDVAKLEAIAAAAKGDDAPIVPGVVFEREAIVSARR